jgi:hypothetical protein
MARFTPQPDEGYSEDPLTALSASTSNSLKPREDAVTPLGSARLTDEFPAWLVQHVSNLSLSRKTGQYPSLFRSSSLDTASFVNPMHSRFALLSCCSCAYSTPE